MYTQRESFLIAERISLMEPDEEQPHIYDGIIEIEPDEFKSGCDYAFKCDFSSGRLMDITFIDERGFSHDVHCNNFVLISQLFPQWDELIDIADRKAADKYEEEVR